MTYPNVATAAAARQANSLMPGDRILLNLPANGKGRKHTISEMFDHEGYRINGIGTRLDLTRALGVDGLAVQDAGAPGFPVAEYTAAVQAAGTAEHESVKVISHRYLTALAEYRAKTTGFTGGRTFADRLGEEVLRWVSATFGIVIGTSASNNEEYINPASVAVVIPLREGTNPVVFPITLTPVWGNR